MDAGRAPQAAEIAAALTEGGAEEREHACATIEGIVRGSSAKDEAAVALAMACVEPLVSLLCAPASRVGEAEWVRASVLLFEMCKLDMINVSAELFRRDDAGKVLFLKIWPDTAPDTVFAKMIAKDEWTRDDAILAAAHYSFVAPLLAAGPHDVVSVVGWGGHDLDWVTAMVASNPIIGENAQPADRYVPLALLMLDLVRAEVDTQPEAVIVGAGVFWFWGATGRPLMGKALWEAGILDVLQATIHRYNPIEMIGHRDLIPTSMLAALRDVTEAAQQSGIEVVQPLVDAGVVDIAVSALVGYQMLGKPEAASVGAIVWGALSAIETMLRSPQQAQPVVAKLRSAGVDSFRYLLDHPLVLSVDLGVTTPVTATRIAAQVCSLCSAGCYHQSHAL